jgi:hypothetical protein
VKDPYYGCPSDYQFQFLTVAFTGGIGITYSLDRCLPAGAITICQAPAVVPPATVLTYSTPAYTRGSLTACIRAAAGPVGVTPPAVYSCPNSYPLTAVRSGNPLQQPPSAAADIIVGCHSADSLCFRDVASKPFALVDAGLPKKTYVSKFLKLSQQAL